MSKEIFQTQRLIARVWEESDLALALELWGDPDVTLFIDIRGHLSPEMVKERLHEEIKKQNTYGVEYWPLFEKSSGEFVGCCGLRPWIYTPQEKKFELGFHIVKRCWGKGFATEAALGAIGYARDTLGATQLFAGHHQDNLNSKKVLLKLGFRYREDVFYEPTGRYHPSYILDPIPAASSQKKDP